MPFRINVIPLIIALAILLVLVLPRYLTNQFLDFPGEVKYAYAGEFPKRADGAYICEGTRGDVHPYKVVSTDPPKAVYICSSFWVDNLPVLWMNLSGATEGYSQNRMIDALPNRALFDASIARN